MEDRGRPAPRPVAGVRRRLRLRLGLWLLDRLDRGESSPSPGANPRRLPSVRRFAAVAKVHRNTAAAVYRDLQRFGLVRCVRGSGTYVARPPDVGPRARAACGCPDLRAILAAELGGVVRGATGDRNTPLLLPLDVSPPPARSVVPLAPRGRSLTALRRLRSGDDVVLLSGSPRLGCLVRHVIEALHGNEVGFHRAEGPVADHAAPGVLVLGDARRSVAHGTSRAATGLIHLRLVSGAGEHPG